MTDVPATPVRRRRWRILAVVVVALVAFQAANGLTAAIRGESEPKALYARLFAEVPRDRVLGIWDSGSERGLFGERSWVRWYDRGGIVRERSWRRWLHLLPPVLQGERETGERQTVRPEDNPVPPSLRP